MADVIWNCPGCDVPLLIASHPPGFVLKCPECGLAYYLRMIERPNRGVIVDLERAMAELKKKMNQQQPTENSDTEWLRDLGIKEDDNER